MARRKINPERAQALEEAKRVNRNAAAKMRRLAAKGIKLSPDQDPRAAVAKLARLTTKQLIAHAERVQTFNNRSNQFEAGVEGQAISAAKWKRYKAAEAAQNAKVAERMAEFGDLQAPGTGQSIRDREATMVNHQARLHGADARNKPFTVMNRMVENINGEEALDQLIKKMEAKLKKQYLPVELKKQREHAQKMLERIGDDDLLDQFNKLTENQFDVWWNETDAADDLSHNYHTIMSMAAGSQERWYQQVVEDRHGDIQKSLQWAKDLPRTKPKK